MSPDAEFYARVLDVLTDGVYFVDREGRITYWNRAAEAITGYSRDQVLGKRCSDGLLCHVDDEGCQLCDCDTGCPLSATMGDGRERKMDVYLHHANGHRLPIQVRSAPLRDDAGKIVGAVEVFADNAPRLAEVRRLRDLEQMAFLDELTGLGNRRSAEQALEARREEASRYGWQFGVMFVDLDRFKQANDRYGHAVGDDLLRMVARNLEGALRVFDYAGRWGGEEFLAIVVHVDGPQLAAIAERFRMLVENSALSVGDERVQVTVSVGATIARAKETVESLVGRADALLYRSKQRGRNRVTMDEDDRAATS